MSAFAVEPHSAEELFQAFRQAEDSTSRHYGGSGLGLSICHHLVELTGGKIRARSQPGKGSRFIVELPLEPAEPPHKTPSTGLITVPENSLSILLADDEPINRMILTDMLRTLGHRALEASTGREAVDLVATNPCDLVILDVQMPELDGPACAREIRALDGDAASVPIIGLTADMMIDKHAQYLADGFDHIYTKPIELKALRRAIAESISLPEEDVPKQE